MTRIWLPLTLLCALSLATSDALTKRAVQRHNEYLVAWLKLLVSVPFLLPLLFLAPLPEPGRAFYTSILIALPLEVVTIILYTRALKISPLSLTVPFLSLTPVFLLAVPFLLLGERISAAGAAGVLLIAAGGYTLNLREVRKGFLAPFRAIGREKGSLYMIAVAFIFSFTATLGKRAISASSPLFFPAVYVSALVVVMAPIALWKGRKELRGVVRDGTLKAAAPPGILLAVTSITHSMAVSLTNVAYMISVKRLSLLFAVLYGHFLFREEGIAERPLGTTLMIAGVALIVLFP